MRYCSWRLHQHSRMDGWMDAIVRIGARPNGVGLLTLCFVCVRAVRKRCCRCCCCCCCCCHTYMHDQILLPSLAQYPPSLPPWLLDGRVITHSPSQAPSHVLSLRHRLGCTLRSVQDRPEISPLGKRGLGVRAIMGQERRTERQQQCSRRTLWAYDQD